MKFQMYDMIEFIEEMESYTFFVPDNYAWTQYKKPVVCKIIMHPFYNSNKYNIKSSY